MTHIRCSSESVPENTKSATIAVTDPDHWSHRTRIAGHGLSMANIPGIIKKVQETHVFGIETDNDIPGRYDSWLDPAEKLEAIREMAAQAHAAGNYAFVYIAGMECITAEADSSEHSFYKDHPDWVQADRNGNLAIFSEKDAFWISKGDEDVWISPFAPEWREQWMAHVRAIAATGIDGLWLDIPYWMTHFDGWWDTWASFDKYTVAEFKNRTGLDAFTDLELGNYDDPNFLKWLDFRLDAITEFVAEAQMNIQSVNPNCLLIPEIYPGIGEDAVVVGADVYRLYAVSDAIAHEYSEGGYTAAGREPIDWFAYMTGMLSFRAFAEGKASWMLSYSWDEEENISASDAMENMFMSQIMSGTNPYDARGHVMSGSNDYETRARVYNWISEHENTFFSPRLPINPVGVYFSPKSRDYFTNDFVPAYKGLMYLLLQSHMEFEIVTPRTLADFKGTTLLMPESRILNQDEINLLKGLSSRGCKILTTGETGLYSTQRQKLETNVLADLSQGIKHIGSPGLEYYNLAHKEFNASAYTDNWVGNACTQALKIFQETVTKDASAQPLVSLKAGPGIATQIAQVDGKPHVFIANYTGIIAEKNANQIPQKDVEILFMDAGPEDNILFLPYLGEIIMLESEYNQFGLSSKLPPITRGAVVWLEKKI
ncbi:hypothetical protein HQ531_03110 [bacterium]|nr:hypothetical protein [bacterium]